MENIDNAVPTTEESLMKEIQYIMCRNANEKFLRALLTRALILEELFNSPTPKRVVKDFLIKFTKKSQTSVFLSHGRVYFPRTWDII